MQNKRNNNLVLLNMVENKDISVERRTCTFNVEEFSSWYHGGSEKLQEKRFFGKLVNFGLFCGSMTLQKNNNNNNLI